MLGFLCGERFCVTSVSRARHFQATSALRAEVFLRSRAYLFQ